MEKGKRYLILIQNKKRKVIREIECLDVTKTCYLVNFKTTIRNSFNLDLFDSKIEWTLKEDFSSKIKILEELPEEEKSITENTTIDELFEKKEDKV